MRINRRFVPDDQSFFSIRTITEDSSDMSVLKNRGEEKMIHGR